MNAITEENAMAADENKEAEINEIMLKLDERKHPKKYAVKRAVKKGLQRAADKLDKAAEGLENLGKEKFDRTDYDKNADFDTLSPEQQATSIADTIVDKRDRKKHPVKRKLADFLKDASKVFASGSDKIAVPDMEIAKRFAKGQGRG